MQRACQVTNIQKQTKSQRRYKLRIENKKRKRKSEKLRKKRAYLEKIKPQIQDGTYTSKRVMKENLKEQFAMKVLKGLKFCIDCSFENIMSLKECNKFAQQLCRLYGANRKSSDPLDIHLINLVPSGRLMDSCRAKCDGFNDYKIGKHEGNVHSVFPDYSEIIYLSPDSDEPLLKFSPSCIYIVGCLVDEHVLKGKSLEQGKRAGYRVCRLPIQEFFGENTTKSPVLAINHIVDIILAYLTNELDWRTAFSLALPPRFIKSLC